MKKVYTIIAILLICILITGCASEWAGNALRSFGRAPSSGTPAMRAQESLCQDDELKNDAIMCGFVQSSALQAYAPKDTLNALDTRVSALESELTKYRNKIGKYEIDMKFVESAYSERSGISAEAHCGTGYTLIGGGCSIQGSCSRATLHGMTRSMIDTGENVFKCASLGSISSGCYLSAQAHCMKIIPYESGVTVDIDFHVEEGPEDTSSSAYRTANCPAGYTLIGGGCNTGHEGSDALTCFASGDERYYPGITQLTMNDANDQFTCKFLYAAPDESTERYVSGPPGDCFYQAQAYCLKVSATKDGSTEELDVNLRSHESLSLDDCGGKVEIGCEDYTLIGGGCSTFEATCVSRHSSDGIGHSIETITSHILQDSAITGLIDEQTCRQVATSDCGVKAQSYCLKIQ